jgi:hypothetical protein
MFIKRGSVKQFFILMVIWIVFFLVAFYLALTADPFSWKSWFSGLLFWATLERLIEKLAA